MATTAEDRKLILRKFLLGAKKTHLAREFGLSVGRIAQIIAVEQFHLENTNPGAWDGLTVRTKHTLMAVGLTSRQQILAAYRAKKLKEIPNCGSKSIEEIRVWLNEPLPTKQVRDPCTCQDFQRATEGGTDSEGYGPAIGIWQGPFNYYIGGLINKPLKFCPYCGKPLQLPKN